MSDPISDIDVFLATGSFPKLWLNMPAAEAVAVLGEPEAVMSGRKFSRNLGLRKGDGIWKYGQMEMGFGGGEIFYLGIYLLKKGGLPRSLGTDAFPFDRTTRKEQLKDYLAARHDDWDSPLRGDGREGPMQTVRFGPCLHSFFDIGLLDCERIMSSTAPNKFE